MGEERSIRGADRLSVVVIAGMHRSGTSLVARVINLLGVDLGDPEHLMAAKADNPTGFWENTAVASFNDDLLAQLGGGWDHPPAPLDGWEDDPVMAPWVGRARDLVAAEFGAGSRVAWKDPRLSLVLPFWRRVVDIDQTFVVVRDPHEVAGSLAARSGMDPEIAADLWLRYTVAALRDADAPVMIRYSAFFEDLDGTIDRLAGRLHLPTPSGSVRTSIAEFFDPGLRHHREPVEATGGSWTEAAVAVDRMLATAAPARMFDLMARGWQAEEVQRTLDRSQADLADMIGQRDVALSQRDISQAEAERAVAETAIAVERTRIAGEALGRLERLGERLRAQVEEARHENQTLKREAASNVGDGR